MNFGCLSYVKTTRGHSRYQGLYCIYSICIYLFEIAFTCKHGITTIRCIATVLPLTINSKIAPPLVGGGTSGAQIDLRADCCVLRLLSAYLTSHDSGRMCFFFGLEDRGTGGGSGGWDIMSTQAAEPISLHPS